MPNAPSVSVCMPACRPSPLFDEALRAALDQTMDDIEIIVTDDSGGQLHAAVSRARDDRVRYIPNAQPLGIAGNHCKAFELVRGRYVAVLHDDDAWLPRYLETMSEVLDRHPGVGLVISAATEVSGDGVELRQRPTAMPPGIQPDPLRHILDERFLMAVPSLTVWRREALDTNHRPWPDLINADVTAFVDPIIAGWGMYYQHLPLVRYRVHDGQIGAQKQFLHRDGLVKLWSSYRFAREDHERLRRHLLARWYLARAGAHLKSDRPRHARADVARAWRTDHRAGTMRSIGLQLLCAAPRLTRAAEQTLRWLRGWGARVER